MTTERTIESLEAKLTAMTEDCNTCRGRGCIEYGNELENCGICEGGVVPLIEGSRRECPGMQPPSGYLPRCLVTGSQLNDSEDLVRWFEHQKQRGECESCNGLRYVPDLSMSKLIRHMQRHRVVRFAEIRRDITTVTWGLFEEEDPDPYHALLLVCYEGELEARDDN